ncbi:MAG: T9SS type A sorting domain-containing protein, partial [Bacteroidales bacterium]|nr:T9SS type A sorting domain-containing protein [Bacteroidales bacterium]
KTYTSSTNLWTLDSIDLPLASDNYYLAFEAVSQNGNTIYLDNIEIDAILQTPIVQSNSATLSSYNSIHIEGEVVYLGLSSVNDRGVCWTTDGSIPDVSDLKLQVGSGIGQFSTTLTNLSPETTYRVRTYATNSYGTSYGRDYIITTPPTPIFNNTITGNQHICYYSVTQNLQGSLPTGGNGQFTYLWLQSPDSLNWELASDPDLRILQSYLSFRAEQTHYYKRIVYSRLVSDTSNIVLIEVSPRTRAGNVFRVQDTIALNDTLKMELRAFVGDKFVWERKKLNFSWEELPLAPDSNWIEDSPEELGKYFYRVRVTSGVCAEEISGEDWTYVKKDIGLEEIIENENSIIIYPNPSQGEINIKYNNDEVFVGKLSLYDINSKEIKTIENQVLNKGDNRINLNPIGIGSYLLVLKNKDNVITKILIINK